MNSDIAVSLLRRSLATDDQYERQQLVREFQRAIWGGEGLSGNEDADDVLVTGAHDLDFYEPNSERRQEDGSFFGDEEFGGRVREVLLKLERLTAG